MPNFETVRRIPYHHEIIYDIVADVERYPEFLPLCDRLEILSETKQDETIHIEADMTVAYLKFQETFRSTVILDKPNNTIATTSAEPPFKHLENQWHFVPVSDNSTDVHFKIDYAFKSWPLEKLMGAMFEKAFRTYAASFEARAKSLSPSPLDKAAPPSTA